MAFDGTEAEKVTIEEAAAWTAAYRRTMGRNDLKGHVFGKNILADILKQDGCVGIKIYYGKDRDKPCLICVGVDANEEDMINGIIAERAFGCPPRCGKENQLNS